MDLFKKFVKRIDDDFGYDNEKLARDLQKIAEEHQALQLQQTDVSSSYFTQNMETLEKIISNEELNESWGNANFGDCSKRDVLKSTLLKCASGYYTGHTAKCIVEDLGLVTLKWTLTKKGKKYLYEAFSHECDV